jgi:hypothetical protein
MLKVAPLGKRELKDGFTRRLENGAPIPRRTFLQEISPLVRYALSVEMTGWRAGLAAHPECHPE